MSIRGVVYAVAVIMAAAFLMFGCSDKTGTAEKTEDPVARGAYLVNLGGCNDCHSPKIFTDQGPMPDTTRLLAGHTPDDTIGPYPADIIGPSKWGGAMSNMMTAWAGPWGISYAANLTPAKITGMWAWNDTLFIEAMRTGKHMGSGQPILPPMPWQFIGQLTDDDLRAIFAYLQSLPPIDNLVPQPVPPPAAKK
jgi:hypothetical protein